MPTLFEIKAGGGTVAAELFDTDCAQAIADALPITAKANTWGEEIYFTVGVDARMDDSARDVVQLRDIGYWPAGDVLCFFFGLTPVSRQGQIRPASPVNLVGRIHGDLAILKRVCNGEEMVLRATEEE